MTILYIANVYKECGRTTSNVPGLVGRCYELELNECFFCQVRLVKSTLTLTLTQVFMLS